MAGDALGVSVADHFDRPHGCLDVDPLPLAAGSGVIFSETAMLCCPIVSVVWLSSAPSGESTNRITATRDSLTNRPNVPASLKPPTTGRVVAGAVAEGTAANARADKMEIATSPATIDLTDDMVPFLRLCPQPQTRCPGRYFTTGSATCPQKSARGGTRRAEVDPPAPSGLYLNQMPASRPTRISLLQAEDQALAAWLQIARVFQKVQRRLDRVLDAAGLTLPQFDVLASLGMVEGITQQDLAARLLVTKGNICGLLDRMEAAGLVERRPDPRDRRANRLYLTAKGRTALQNAFPTHLGLLHECLEPLSATELRSLMKLLTKIEVADCSE